jgi:hypothetical protein
MLIPLLLIFRSLLCGAPVLSVGREMGRHLEGVRVESNAEPGACRDTPLTIWLIELVMPGGFTFLSLSA